jgi:hypothetical protein
MPEIRDRLKSMLQLEVGRTPCRSLQPKPLTELAGPAA